MCTLVCVAEGYCSKSLQIQFNHHQQVPPSPLSTVPLKIVLQWTQTKITSFFLQEQARYQIPFPLSQLVAPIPMLFSSFRFLSSFNSTLLYSYLLNHSNSLPPLGLRFYHSHSKLVPNHFDVDNAVLSFNRMLQMRNTPSIVEFTKILGSLVKTKNHYATVISLSRQMESKGIKPDLYTSSILINCYCHLGQIGFCLFCIGQDSQNGLST
jgi:hypothetical protein